MSATPEKPKSRPRASLTEQAYVSLRQRIFTGAIAPGAEISEPELADLLAMSKTPVREALARLGAEGFVMAIPRRGYRVAPITLNDMNDLFAVRSVLEGAAGALAASHLTEQQFDALDQMAQASYRPGETPSIAAFIKANERFHSAIAAASRNVRLAQLVTSHLEECARFFYLGARARDLSISTNSEHREIVATLRRRDPEAARDALLAHNEHTRLGLLRAILGHDALAFQQTEAGGISRRQYRRS